MTKQRPKEPELLGDVLEPARKEREMDVRAVIAYGMTNIAKIEERVLAIQIHTQKDLEEAAEGVSLAQKLAKALETKRLELTKPLVDEKAAIDKRFKDLITRLEDVKKAMIVKIDGWKAEERKRIQEENRKREEEQEQQRLAAMLEAEQTTSDLGVEVPSDMLMPEAPPPVLEQPARRVETTTGGVGERTIWKWKVVDIDKVPDRYFTLNESMIGKEVREGTREIPGIEIYPETVTVAI